MLHKEMAQFALENTPMQVFWIDESGCFVEANPAACQALGYSHEELLALCVSDLDINIPSEQWGSFFRELRSAGKRIYETQCRQKSGALIDVEITLSLFEQEGQEFVCALGHDIGKRKRAESELKRASRRMSVAADSAAIGIWEWDLISNELIWDSRMFHLYGIEPESFAGAYEAWEQGLHPDDRDRMNEEVEVALRGEQEFDSEFRIITPAGEVRYIKANSEVIRDESGQPVRMIGVNFDITEQRSLYERAEMLQRLADHSDLGIGWAGMDTRARYINPTMKRMLGVAEDEDASKFAFTDFYTEDQLKRLQECVLPDVMSQGRWIGELEVKSLDGMITPTVHNVFLLKDTEGKPAAFANVLIDLTAQKQIEAELRDLNEQLENQVEARTADLNAALLIAEHANDAKSQFLSRMSHELRTPLNAVLGFAQLLKLDSGLEEMHGNYVEEILGASHHLLELINEVLDIAKIESGNIDMTLQEVELNEVLDECLALVGALAEQYQISLDVQCDKGVVVLSDKTRLKQVLLNLLSNAIKYNNKGEVRLTVEIRGEQQMRIEIADTGSGISNGDLELMFQPFNRLGAENSTIEGSGIGLTLTRHIVELMGSTLDVVSELGKGSSFWFELPAGDVSKQKETDQKLSSPIEMDLLSKVGARTVLYIEDNPVNLMFIQQLLTRCKNIKLLTAEAPRRGIDLAIEHQPDLILLDINLPEMDGYQVMEYLQEKLQFDTTPIIAITANAMQEDIERGIEAGFTDYLTKPLDIRHFYGVVEKALQLN